MWQNVWVSNRVTINKDGNSEEEIIGRMNKSIKLIKSLNNGGIDYMKRYKGGNI